MTVPELLGCEIYRYHAREGWVEGIIEGVTPSQLYVMWHDSGRRRYVDRKRMHHDRDRKTGYFVPRPKD